MSCHMSKCNKTNMPLGINEVFLILILYNACRNRLQSHIFISFSQNHSILYPNLWTSVAVKLLIDCVWAFARCKNSFSWVTNTNLRRDLLLSLQFGYMYVWVSCPHHSKNHNSKPVGYSREVKPVLPNNKHTRGLELVTDLAWYQF